MCVAIDQSSEDLIIEQEGIEFLSLLRRVRPGRFDEFVEVSECHHLFFEVEFEVFVEEEPADVVLDDVLAGEGKKPSAHRIDEVCCCIESYRVELFVLFLQVGNSL